jgi:hypothetical protein
VASLDKLLPYWLNAVDFQYFRSGADSSSTAKKSSDSNQNNQEDREMTKLTDEVLGLIAKTSAEERRDILQELRRGIFLHPLERAWNVPAEAILAAISRSPDITQRGIRGILAEAVFEQSIIPALLAKGWEQLEISGHQPYDFRLSKEHRQIGIQVKLQRKQSGSPMEYPKSRREHLLKAPERLFCVEVQKTRSGRAGGEATRPYHFGDFDILAVSLHPSTGDWKRFVFTVGKWLLPRENNPELIEIFQPVPDRSDLYWSDDLEACITWSQVKERKTLYRK